MNTYSAPALCTDDDQDFDLVPGFSGCATSAALARTGKKIHDLRHTCLTNRLNSGTPLAQVAESAGNSVPVLLATYVKCISGQASVYLSRIEATLAIPSPAKEESGEAQSSGREAAGPQGE